MSIPTDRRANLIGSLWMIAAMGAFAIEDAAIKAAAQSIPVGQVIILFGLGGAAVFALMALAKGEPLYVADVASRPMRIRVIFEIIGRLFYFLAITLMPLSVATVILQATPLVVVAAATVIFGETVGWRRWTAILLGLLGVVIIVQPGADGFSAVSILAIIGMLGFAGRDLASRAAPATLSTRLLGLYGFLSIVIAGVMFSLWQGQAFVWPDNQAALFIVGAVFSGVAAYTCLMTAMRTGEVSAVTPFRYSRLLFGVALGVVFFGEDITVPMVIGSAMIVVSGLFILYRKRGG